MRIDYLKLAFIFVFFSYIFCEKAFDDLVRPVDLYAQVQIAGYKNLKNKGVSKGCCGDVIRKICQPCRMMVVTVQQNWYYDLVKYTTIYVFSKASSELYERYEQYLMFASNNWNVIQLLMYTFNVNKTIQEGMPEIYTKRITTYKYDGAFGINNVLQLWADITLVPTNMENRYYMSMIRIDSLYFKEYRDWDKQCATQVPDDLCPDEVPYSIKWMASYRTLEWSYDLVPNTDTRQHNISFTLVSIDKPGPFVANVNYMIVIYSTFYHTMDSIKILKINDLPNIEYSIKNRMGAYSNIIFNISWMHNCQIYGGINCKDDCQADFGTEYCDMFTGKAKCLNGASDANTCINIPTACEKDTCSNNGVCFVIQGRAKCNCQPGFTGKFCQDVQCDTRCNGNGRCIGPNLCSCFPPNTGKECDEYPCDEETAKICGQYGNCIIRNGFAQCDCWNKFTKGVNCTEAICDKDCIFGKCLYNKRLDMTNCVCNELYQGISCNITILNFDQKSYWPNLSAPIAVIIIVFIALIVICVLIYKNIINVNFAKFNLFPESTDQLSTVAEQ